MPAVRAASIPSPTARASNPWLVRLSQNQTPKVATSASTKPAFSLDRLPRILGSSAVWRISSVPERDRSPEAVARSGPTTSQFSTRLTATQFSMMVEITSWTPRRSLSTAGKSAYSAPATAAPTTASTGWTPGGARSLAPITAATMAPTVICPWAPMLNRPTQKATETARPVRVSSAAFAADSPHARVKISQPAPEHLQIGIHCNREIRLAQRDGEEANEKGKRDRQQRGQRLAPEQSER